MENKNELTELKLDFNERSDCFPNWLIEATKNLNLNFLWKYPDKQEFEKKLAKTISCSEKNILSTNGADEGIDLIFRMAAKQKRKILLPLPAFGMYLEAAEKNSLNLLKIFPKPNFALNKKLLLNSVSKNQLIVLTSPNNPTGEVLDELFLRKLILYAERLGSLVLIDAAYGEFSLNDFSIKLAKEFNNVLVLKTFSKIYGLAGIRLGYIFAKENILNEVKYFIFPFNISDFSLQLGLRALENDVQTENKEYSKIIKKNVDYITNQCKNIFSLNVIKSESNFIFLQLSRKRSELLYRFLISNRVKVRKFNENYLKGCIRITIPKNIDRLFLLMQQILRPSLICLDMDGVLIDTQNTYDQCIISTVNYFTDLKITVDDLNIKRNLGGLNCDWELTKKIIKDKTGKNYDIEIIKNYFQLRYQEIINKNNQEKVLINHKTGNYIKKYNLAIVTGRPREEALAGSRQLPIKIKEIISRDDVKNLKPSSEGIELIKNKLQTDKVWMVGDTIDDIRAAISANAVAIGVGKKNKEYLLKTGAHFVIDSINEIGDLLR
ncbi:aminotransferase class I/II-fold pyridoxal phosphate-dependent enzyme [Pigmentibacter ruber]|uniref:aminotransferase class I/II-fold pyridoxal phosphate-dependent enzyme n=1 Tax=Pigmentibacter ruber TaxID=2683196 RepID=UPI00131C846B|nr:aminotransferase class I/II-fold pyridoxal phosphate-dependent enzyme [Pigmentibacter ruber]